jgi:hypothetical protein
MRFNVSMHSLDMQEPVHIFPGDAPEDLAHYPDLIMNGYISSAPTVYGAARALGVYFDEETFERTKRVCATGGLLDDFLDESDDQSVAAAEYDKGLLLAAENPDAVERPADANPQLERAVRLLINSVEPLGQERKALLVQAGRTIGHIAVAKAACGDVSEYITLLRAEAAATSQLVCGVASDAVRHRPKFDSFRRWCGDALTLATLADSAWDLGTDAARGRTRVPATMRNSGRIAVAAIAPLGRLLRTYDGRHAGRGALAARLRFSLRPTPLIITRHRRAGAW